ncbi:hypothetical protein O7626_39635 [Micromonospora sp. WMMD1102]|uniref:hypothetical protein n=1 Tax=Micromonospora sp. WMMD1102 TaxID=3016105 RepID=UPI0024156FA6|nr:hypothetical protein [Micromonospora sp. WMMD1102]MDG4791927.1 hypothetical protein [Micromonospora sp. WMMD1102]
MTAAMVCAWCGRQLTRYMCCWERGSEIRPPIDLDLGVALQFGYHRPPARVVNGPPHLLNQWPSSPSVAAAVSVLLSGGVVLTTTELASRLNLTERERQNYLWPALVQMTRLGRVERAAGRRHPQPVSWRLAAVA